MALEVIKPGQPFCREVTTNQATGETTFRLGSDAGTVLHPHTGMIVSAKHTDTLIMHPDDPNSARGTSTWEKSFKRGEWNVSIALSTTVRALRDVWRIETHIVAKEGDKLLLEREDVKEFARDLN
ncbi:hypothetical protein EOA31_36930 [Mesorhizobium sp. M4B.F.Ca.ET.049.02.1.2]|nr:hypothetical protein EOA31_36930 [Mesorhizobium sp. M4B.F.Ca.ET.049.02.1.2]